MLRRVLLLKFVIPGLVAALPAQRAPESPRAVLDTAIARMGGDSLLASMRTVRLDVVTQWFRTSFATTPLPYLSSYERNAELRDYAGRSWRNTRTGLGTPGAGMAIVDIVRDTIGYRSAGTIAMPLNRTYIQERRELFITAVERLLPQLRDARDLRALADTVLDGAPIARIAGTVDGFALTLLLRRDDGLPLALRFRADEADDFGLAQWGEHEIATWYSNWQRASNGAILPRQVDVLRVGRPYKRMTYLAVTPNAPAPADSFAIPDSMVTRYLATERRPMWELPIAEQGRIIEERFATIPPLMGSAGAVQVGGRWVVLETAQHPEAMAMIAGWLAKETGAVRVGLGIATVPAPANGGARWFVANGVPMVVGPGSRPIVEQITGPRGLTVVTSGRWLRVGSDSLWVEPVSAPDFAGALAVYVPSLKWLYLPFAGIPAAQRTQAALLAEYARRGWPVELIGSARVLRRAVQ